MPRWNGSSFLPHFDVALSTRQPHIDDYRDLPGLEVRPPDVHRYVVRVKPDALEAFARTAGLKGLDPRQLEDEFVFRNSYQLNETFYASLGEKRAFVLSHGRDQLIFKMVGYAEQNVEYYQLQDFRGPRVDRASALPHQGPRVAPRRRAPLRRAERGAGTQRRFRQLSLRVRVPAAAQHPPAVSHRHRGFRPALRFVDRVYQYPLEYIIEALAPTTELDFDQLPPEKQVIYRQIQATHMHASPDGPWFFIIARNHQGQFQLLGITDTAMLRPQVFAFSDSGEVQIGLVCSEKQAIDATLRSLAKEDPRFCPVADKYWNARGGSSSDGGAFVFTVSPAGDRRQAAHLRG